MTLFEHDPSPAMRYEGLARAAFGNCSKSGDPWGYAAQDHYSSIVLSPDLKGKRMLSTILIKLIVDNPKHQQTPKLIELEERVWTADEQEKIRKIIDEAIEAHNSIESTK